MFKTKGKRGRLNFSIAIFQNKWLTIIFFSFFVIATLLLLQSLDSPVNENNSLLPAECSNERIHELEAETEQLKGYLSSRVSMDMHEEVVNNLNHRIKQLEAKLTEKEAASPKDSKKGFIDKSGKAIQGYVPPNKFNPSSGNEDMSAFKYEFMYGERKCLLHLGGCYRVGCDGAVWISTMFCADGFSRKVAVKFHKTKETHFKNETDVAVFFEDLLKDWSEVSKLMTVNVAYVYVPIHALRDTTADCVVLDFEKAGRKCHALYQQQWTPPEQTVRGFVMPVIHEGWCNMAAKEPRVRQQALSIVYDLTKIFMKMNEVNTIHCDMNWAHISISQLEADEGLGIVPRLFDFSRVKRCKRKQPNCYNGLVAQGYQYGSLIIDLCTKSDKCFPTGGGHYIHSMGPCKTREMKDKETLLANAREKIDHELIEKKINKEWVCPHKETLVGAVNTVYKSFWEMKMPDWEHILETLKIEIDKV